jgi:hypothetical protein
LWLNDATSFCNNVIEDSLQPLTKCIKRDYLAYWNDRPGISIDDNDSKDEICVELDEQPDYATFFDELTKNADEEATLLNRWFEWEDTSDDVIQETIVVVVGATTEDHVIYNIGDVIEHLDATRGIRMNFPLPQADMFERCDFSSYATFYSEVDVECQFVITSFDECTTVLSPSTYADMTITEDKTSTTVVPTTIGTSSTDPAVTAAADCTNTLTTLKLDFYFTEPNVAGFQLSKVIMDYEVDAAAKAVGDVVELHVITNFYRDTTSTVNKKSGNPGYLAGERLLLADTVATNIELTGYRKDISDSAGECLADDSTLTTITNNYVDFLEDINMSCNKTVADVAAFQAECTSTAYQGLYMFDQFTLFGKYGTAQTSDSADWTDIITQAVTTAPSYDAATTTCTNMITTIQYEILVSYHGYEDNLQYYVEAINAKPLQEDVTYTTDNNFIAVPYRVIFTSYIVLPDSIRNDDKIPYQFPPDLSGSTKSTISRGESSNSDKS